MSSTGSMINGFDPSDAGGLSAADRDLITRRAAVLGPAYKLFYRHPVHFVRSEGVWLYDAQGNAFLDAYNNVPCVGHCHPRVVEAIARQAATLNTHTRYLHEGVVAYSTALLATFPDALGHVMYTCTGSEAVDLALRIARFTTGGEGMIVTANAYHGVTSATAELSPSLGEHVPRGANVITVPAPDQFRAADQDVGATLASHVRQAIATMQRRGIKLAGMIADTILSSDGIFPHPRGVFQEAVSAVRAAGGLFIADEVQPGFGRTGEAMWGFQRHGFIPDIAVMGKPMGNGMPIAAVAMRPELVAEFGAKIRYFNTFAANTVSIAAAQAVLDVIQDERLMANAVAVGAHLREGLSVLARRHASIGDVRGAGLYVGVEIVRDPASKAPHGGRALDIVNRLRDKQVLISASGPSGNVLKIRPPLPFSITNADTFLSRFEDVLDELS